MYAIWKPLIWGIVLAAFSLVPATRGRAQDSPDIIELDSLSRLYEGVTFDHAMHLDVANCAECHHHGTGAPVQDENCARCHSLSEEKAIVGCGACHPEDPFSAEELRRKGEDIKRYHRDKPGLKAAYHQNCLGCHRDMGAPVGCQDCHRRTDAGDAFFHAGEYAPKGGTAGGGH